MIGGGRLGSVSEYGVEIGSFGDARLDRLLRELALGNREAVRPLIFSCSVAEVGDGNSGARDSRRRVDDDVRRPRFGSEMLAMVLSKAAAAIARMPEGFCVDGRREALSSAGALS